MIVCSAFSGVVLFSYVCLFSCDFIIVARYGSLLCDCLSGGLIVCFVSGMVLCQRPECWSLCYVVERPFGMVRGASLC